MSTTIGPKRRVAESRTFDAERVAHGDIENLLGGLLAKLSQGVAITDASCPEHPVVYFNEAFELLLDLSGDDIRGRPHPFVLANAMDSEARVRLGAALKARTDLDIQLQYRRKDGILAWIAVDLHLLDDSVGGTSHHVWLHRDVGHTVASEELWKRFEAIVNTSKESMAFVSEDYTYELTNDEMCRSHGVPSGALIGKKGADIWGHDVFAQSVEPYLARCFSGNLVRGREWFDLPAGGKRYLETIYYPYAGQTGTAGHAVCVSRDITDQKNSEDSLRALNAELEQRVAARTADLERANQDLDSFNYSVAHDLRSPLKLMKAFAGLLSETIDSPLSEEGERHLGFLQGGLSQMDRLIKDLLRFSRIGRQPIKKQTVNQIELVAEVISELLESHPERRIETSVGDLPQVEADPAMLRQVYVNLISNALKFTRAKDVARIEVGWSESDGDAVFYVKDNGIGFDPRHEGTIFGVFKRLETSEEFEGSGVGLAIVRRIVEGHGGRVWAIGEIGKGATVHFSFGKLMGAKVDAETS